MKQFLSNPSKVFAALGVLMLALVVYVVFTALPALAQDAVSGSASQANNSANQVSASGAIAAGGSVTNNFPAQPVRTTTKVQQDGTATLKTAPALGGLALGGGHPCAMSPMTGQISIIGGGIGYGGMEVDEACMLLIMASAAGDRQAYAAATYMLAARDKEACQAMYLAGMVDDCVNKSGVSRLTGQARAGKLDAPRVTVSSNSGGASAPAVQYSKCSYDPASNKITFKKKFGSDVAVAKSQCMKALGY